MLYRGKSSVCSSPFYLHPCPLPAENSCRAGSECVTFFKLSTVHTSFCTPRHLFLRFRSCFTVPCRRLLTYKGHGLTFRVRVRVRVRASMTPLQVQTYLKLAKAHLIGCPLLGYMKVSHHPCYFCYRNTMICYASGYGLVRVKVMDTVRVNKKRDTVTRTRKEKKRDETREDTKTI